MKAAELYCLDAVNSNAQGTVGDRPLILLVKWDPQSPTISDRSKKHREIFRDETQVK